MTDSALNDPARSDIWPKDSATSGAALTIERLRSLTLFAGLSDDQLGELVAGGTEVALTPGEALFREGEHADLWWVLLSGAIELYRHVGREDVLVARMDVPGRWAGGFRAWDDRAGYLATGRVVSSGSVLCVPSELLRSLTNSWFPFGGHLIEGLYRTARTIEATARQRSALVTLGTLSAGLAHELNNPAAAATRSVEALRAANRTQLAAVEGLARQGVTADQLAALDAVRNELQPTTSEDPLDRADREQELAEWLRTHGIDTWDSALSLAAAGADASWCDRVAALLPAGSLEAGLDWVAGTSTAEQLLNEVQESTRRISDLVAAVRSYSQMDRGSLQPTDLTEGLESTLVILGHKIRGVVVVRNYGDVPRINVFAGELNQVWTNLLDNALDAMNGSGTLRLSTHAADNAVVVEIGDTGPGMPAQVRARAFEAFYTTKDVGQGTGLGLDIAQRIVVERHGGTIELDSEPGVGTVARVRLPIR